jgi:hypothetical protein
MVEAKDRIAPEGKIWVCCACGKTSRDKYGDPGTSWDAACVLNSQLFDEDKLVYADDGKRVVRVKE